MMMELSPEDSLRLNVMLANAVAVRIDEGTHTVYCLSESGNEARVDLNPNCRSDTYIRRVRELLSSHVLGSPGGYPVFLKRWTRMGQASDNRLADLLMLGEPEAVVAVTGAPMLTDALAERAWWAMPDSDNARRMLRRSSVVQGRMGKILADFLLEFLPFEQEPGDIIESVRLILAPGLISEQERMEIWSRGRQKNVFRVGFLHATPDELPEPAEARVDLGQHIEALNALADAGNAFAHMLRKLLSEPGQSFLQSCLHILKKPANQDVVVSFLEAVEKYFLPVRVAPFHYDTVEKIVAAVDRLGEECAEMQNNEALQSLRDAVPKLNEEIRAMLILAHTGEPVVRQIFARTDSVGSVMRKKIDPVAQPMREQIEILTGAS